jgi:hypothetical protein
MDGQVARDLSENNRRFDFYRRRTPHYILTATLSTLDRHFPTALPQQHCRNSIAATALLQQHCCTI